MLTVEEARSRVAKGAAHLDQVRPNWFNEIDIGTLTLDNQCGCIVGQLSGGKGFLLGLQRLDIHDHLGVTHGLNLNEPGFIEFQHAHRDLSGGPILRLWYQPLQDAWIEAIADRRLRADVQKTEVVAAGSLSSRGVRDDPAR